MSKLSHPDMKPAKEAKRSPGQPKPETYIVDDPTSKDHNPINDRLAQFEAAPQPENTGEEFELPKRKPISDVLEKLIFVGRTTREVEIGGVTFEISTLSNREQGQIVKAMYRFSEAADLFTVRVLTLANALKKIDGVALDDIDVEGEFEDSFHKRMSVIDHIQMSVVEELFDTYEELIKKEEEAEEEDKEIKN